MQAVDLTTIQKFRTAIFEIFQNLTFCFNPKNYSLSDHVMYIIWSRDSHETVMW